MYSKRACAIVLASVLAGLGLSLPKTNVLRAQTRGGGSEWLTAGGDAQRTSWIRSDAAISVQSLSKPGFELQWKSALDNQSRGSNGLLQGVTANGVTLFVPMSIVTGSSNNVYAIDNDTGYTVWKRHFDVPLPTATAGCPGGITAAATRIVAVAPPAPPRAGGPGGGAAGRGVAGYRGAVGDPGEGAPNMSQRGAGGNRGAAAPGAAGAAATTPPGGRAAGAATAPPDPARAGGSGAGGAGAGGAGAATPPTDPARAGGAGTATPGAAAPGARAAGAGNAGIPGAPGGGGTGSGFGRPAGVGYVISSDGVLHVLGLASGKDLQKPALYLPANARWSDPIAVNDMMYTATSQNCGGAPNGIWAIDLAGENKPVTSWTTNGGGIVGALTFATDGTLLAAIGSGPVTPGGYTNAIVAFDPKTLHVKDWFTSPTVQWASAPVVFKHGDKDIVAAATRDGRVLLFDAAALGGKDHATPLYASRVLTATPTTFAPEALATWLEDPPVTIAPAPAAGSPSSASFPPGTRWLLMPVAGTLPPDLMAGRAITSGAIVALKVADDAGKFSLQPGWVSRDLTSPITPIIVNGVVFAMSRGTLATPAVLYALSGADGKELWTSGTTITSRMTGRSFWSATGQVYVGTADSTLYAFGFAMDRK